MNTSLVIAAGAVALCVVATPARALDSAAPGPSNQTDPPASGGEAAARANPGEAAQPESGAQDPATAQTLPMTKAVVSGKALEDNAQEGYAEAVKSVAGVAPGNSKGSPNDSINIRGIKLSLFSNYRLNGGLPTAGVITTPTENKERIETLKGANALMFGIASPAGIINLVTKRAGKVDVTSVSGAGNGFGQVGASADVGRRFGAEKELGVRLNASATRLENGIRSLYGHGEFASAGVDWKVTSRLVLQGDFEYYAKDVPEQAGVSLLAPVKGVVPITPVPLPRNLLSARWASYTPSTKNAQLRADYSFLDAWKILAEAGISLANRSRFSTRIGNYDINTGAGGTVAVNWVTQDYKNTFLRTELLGKFPTWLLRHDLTFGVSRSERDSATPGQNNVVLKQTQNIYDPIDLAPPVFTKPATSLPLQTSTDVGVYAYDAIAVGPQWKVLLGLRVTRDKEDNGVRRSTTTVATPAFGVLFDLLPDLTLFASYMEGLESGATAPVNAVNAYEILEPAVSIQKEVGIRGSGFGGVWLSASYFEITRANAVTDPTTRVFAANGDIDYKGIEATVRAEVLRRLTITLAGQWLRAIQRSPNDPTINGLVPENTPSALGNLAVSWRLPWVPGLRVNAGASGVTRRFVNPQDQGAIPGYVLFTAGAGYSAQIEKRRLAFQVNVDNLANTRYWNSVQTGTYGTGMDRTVKMSAKVDF
jgi:iron complex outermembrane receptor protein